MASVHHACRALAGGNQQGALGAARKLELDAATDINLRQAVYELPAGLSRGSFNRARWARDGSLGLYTAVNAAGIGYILHWEQVSWAKAASLLRLVICRLTLQPVPLAWPGCLTGRGPAAQSL